MRKGYPEYNDDQARGQDGQWTAGGGSGAKPASGGNGKLVAAGLAGLGLLGAGAAFRFGPAVARYLRSAAMGKPKRTFRSGLRDAAMADARRAAKPQTYTRGARAAGALAGGAIVALGRDAARG